jgi:hypothetical protein
MRSKLLSVRARESDWYRAAKRWPLRENLAFFDTRAKLLAFCRYTVTPNYVKQGLTHLKGQAPEPYSTFPANALFSCLISF